MSALSECNSQRMIALTAAALYGTSPDASIFSDADGTDWQALMEHCAAQGVTVLSLTGAMRLPEQLQPPFALKLSWIARVDAIEKHCRHISETAATLAANFREHAIRMLIIKGLSLSRLYPLPYSREFGDLDIFLCGKSKEGDAILKQLTGKKGFDSKKHVCYNYRGVHIENHHTFLNHQGVSFFHHSKMLEKRLQQILADAGLAEETGLADAAPANESLLFPPPAFNVLFVMLHMLAHLHRKIVLRYLCDLAVLFTAYRGMIDFTFFRDSLTEAGLTKPADALISLTVRHLGLNPEDAPPYRSDRALEDRIWNDMLHPAFSPPPKENRSFRNVFSYKMRILRSDRWKYELVFPGKFLQRIIYSVFAHLLYPKTIRGL